MNRRLSPALIALMAVLIALTAVFTVVIQIPIPAQGYLNLSDVAITFAALAFGPWIGAIAGGVGTAIADLATGYAMYAPISLLAHGVEGFLIGWLGRGRRTVPGMIGAWAAGSAAMVLIYLVGGALLVAWTGGDSLAVGWAASLAQVPFNIAQAVIGAIIGIPLVIAVRKAYPAIDQLGRPRTWTE
jgi:energy-coupling factor transport system substrate-specific component